MRWFISGVFAAVLWGAFKWAFDNFLWDWFTRYLETTWHIDEAAVIANVSSFVGPTLIVGASYWGMWWALRLPGKKISAATSYEVARADVAPIWQATQHIARCIGEPHDATCLPKARAALRQAAADGVVAIRGRKQLPNKFASNRSEFDELLTDVPPKYWLDSVLTAMATAAPGDGWAAVIQTMPRTADAWKDDKYNGYADLRVNMREIRKAWPAPEMHPARKNVDREIDQIRRDIGWLAEFLASHEPYAAQEMSAIKRYMRLNDSDHVLWLDPSLKQLRRDFLNRCGIAMKDQKQFASKEESAAIRHEISAFSKQIDECIVRWLAANI